MTVVCIHSHCLSGIICIVPFRVIVLQTCIRTWCLALFCTVPYAHEVGNENFLFLFLHPDHPFPPHKSLKLSTITSVLTLGTMSVCSHSWLYRFLVSLAVVLDAQTSVCEASWRETEMNLSIDWVVSWRMLQHLNAESMICCFSAVSANAFTSGIRDLRAVSEPLNLWYLPRSLFYAVPQFEPQVALPRLLCLLCCLAILNSI